MDDPRTCSSGCARRSAPSSVFLIFGRSANCSVERMHLLSYLPTLTFRQLAKDRPPRRAAFTVWYHHNDRGRSTPRQRASTARGAVQEADVAAAYVTSIAPHSLYSRTFWPRGERNTSYPTRIRRASSPERILCTVAIYATATRYTNRDVRV